MNGAKLHISGSGVVVVYSLLAVLPMYLNSSKVLCGIGYFSHFFFFFAQETPKLYELPVPLTMFLALGPVLPQITKQPLQNISYFVILLTCGGMGP